MRRRSNLFQHEKVPCSTISPSSLHMLDPSSSQKYICLAYAAMMARWYCKAPFHAGTDLGEEGYLEGHEGGVAGSQQLHQGCSGQVDRVPAHKLQLPLNPYAHDCLQRIATPSCTHALLSHPSTRSGPAAYGLMHNKLAQFACVTIIKS